MLLLREVNFRIITLIYNETQILHYRFHSTSTREHCHVQISADTNSKSKIQTLCDLLSSFGRHGPSWERNYIPSIIRVYKGNYGLDPKSDILINFSMNAPSTV
jgi:hypothetical protein